jgi:hypothetical protein
MNGIPHDITNNVSKNISTVNLLLVVASSRLILN